MSEAIDEGPRDWVPIVLGDGEILIPDLPDFQEAYDAVALVNLGGHLHILQKTGGPLALVQSLNEKPKSSGNVSAIGGRHGSRNPCK